MSLRHCAYYLMKDRRQGNFVRSWSMASADALCLATLLPTNTLILNNANKHWSGIDTWLTQHMPISTGVKGGKEWFYISSKFRHICAEAGNQQWLLFQSNKLPTPTKKGKVSKFSSKRRVQYWSRLPPKDAEAPPLQVFRTQLCKAMAVLL